MLPSLSNPVLGGGEPLVVLGGVRLSRFGGRSEIWDSCPRRSVSCRDRESRIRLSTERRWAPSNRPVCHTFRQVVVADIYGVSVVRRG